MQACVLILVLLLAVVAVMSQVCAGACVHWRWGWVRWDEYTVVLSALIALLTRWCVCGLVGAVCVGAGGGYAGARVAAGGRALLTLCWCSCC